MMGRSGLGDEGFGPAGSRVVIPLPVGDMTTTNKNLLKAGVACLEYIKKTFGGATHTVTFPHAVEGHWFHPSKRKMIDDAICLVLVDTKYGVTNPLLSKKVGYLKNRIHREYVNYHQRQQPTKQKVIYITVEQISIYG